MLPYSLANARLYNNLIKHNTSEKHMQIDNLEVFNKVNSLFTSTQLALINHYIEYLNLYLSIECFAADKGISTVCAGAMIDEGRELQALCSDLYNQMKVKA